mmetsp:Transcript_13050/g.19539  ORF Transcript_13050/g.19539 Transcript_13050/m.19539 type:complete len:126 (+) Transcript_13050:1131-1508(+)
MTYRMHSFTSKKMYVHVNLRPTKRGKDGRVTEVSGTIQDITRWMIEYSKRDLIEPDGWISDSAGSTADTDTSTSAVPPNFYKRNPPSRLYHVTKEELLALQRDNNIIDLNDSPPPAQGMHEKDYK